MGKLPFEVFLVFIFLEEYKEVIRLRQTLAFILVTMQLRMIERTGWLLDLYEDPLGGLALWLLDDDGARRRLRQRFPVTFYAAGPAAPLARPGSLAGKPAGAR